MASGIGRLWSGSGCWTPHAAPSGVVLAFPAVTRRAPADRGLSVHERRRLRALRLLARASSLACRPECAVVQIASGSAENRCGEPCAAELFRAFVEIADRRLVLYRPDADAVSDDEHWLLRLMAALDQGDHAGAGALIAFRVERPLRRQALAAAGAVAARLG